MQKLLFAFAGFTLTLAVASHAQQQPEAPATFRNPLSFPLTMPEKKSPSLEINDVSELQETRYTQKDDPLRLVSPSFVVPAYDPPAPQVVSPAAVSDVHPLVEDMARGTAGATRIDFLTDAPTPVPTY